MQKKRFFILLFLVFIALFAFLYYIGFVNYFTPNSQFLAKFNFLDFGSQLISLFYLIILSIFFIVTVSIMLKLIITGFDRVVESTIPIKKIAGDADLKTLTAEIITETCDKIFKENEKRFVSIIENTQIQEKSDEIYLSISQVITDLTGSATVQELLEKSLYWGATLTNSKRASLMISDKENLTLFKAVGWGLQDKSGDGVIKIKIGEGIAGKCAAANKQIIINDTDNFDGYDFPFKKNYQTSSLIVIPISYKETPVAVLNFTDNGKRGFYMVSDYETLNIIKNIASSMYEFIMMKKRFTAKS